MSITEDVNEWRRAVRALRCLYDQMRPRKSGKRSDTAMMKKRRQRNSRNRGHRRRERNKEIRASIQNQPSLYSKAASLLKGGA